MAIIKKSLLFTVNIVGNKITCVRCNLTGRFVKKSVYVEIVNSEKLDYGVITESKTIDVIQHISKIHCVRFVLCAFVLAIAYSLCYSTIKERQAQYNSINNSNELLTNYYANCGTDSECEQLEAQLNFDFKKGMN